MLLAALIVAGTSARLGFWQLDRAAQKQALRAAIDSRRSLPPIPRQELATQADEAATQHYRRIVLRGRWLASHTVWLDNRQMDGRPGFIAVTPLVWSGGAVAVQRGWAARNNDMRLRLPALATPSGEVEVVGRIAPPPARLYEFAGPPGGAIRQNLDLAAYSREIGVALPPLSVMQDDDAPPAPVGAASSSPPDGLQRRWPRPAVDVQKHYGYAFQWFAICAVTTGLYVWFQLVQPRRRRRLLRTAR